MTKKECLMLLADIPQVKENADLTSFIKKELEQLEKKKNAVSQKRTERQKENDTCADVIFDTMLEQPERLFALSEIVEFHDLPSSDFSSQRVTYLLTKLVNEGKIERIKEKKKSFYKIAN